MKIEIEADSFRCVHCGKVYLKGPVPETIQEYNIETQYVRRFPEHQRHGAPTQIVCEHCYKLISAWIDVEGISR